MSISAIPAGEADMTAMRQAAKRLFRICGKAVARHSPRLADPEGMRLTLAYMTTATAMQSLAGFAQVEVGPDPDDQLTMITRACATVLGTMLSPAPPEIHEAAFAMVRAEFDRVVAAVHRAEEPRGSA